MSFTLRSSLYFLALSLSLISPCLAQSQQALAPLLKSLRLREENNDRVGITRSLTNLGRLYQDQGKYTEMLEVSHRSARLAEEINAREELWSAQERIGIALR